MKPFLKFPILALRTRTNARIRTLLYIVFFIVVITSVSYWIASNWFLRSRIRPWMSEVFIPRKSCSGSLFSKSHMRAMLEKHWFQPCVKISNFAILKLAMKVMIEKEWKEPIHTTFAGFLYAGSAVCFVAGWLLPLWPDRCDLHRWFLTRNNNLPVVFVAGYGAPPATAVLYSARSGCKDQITLGQTVNWLPGSATLLWRWLAYDF